MLEHKFHKAQADHCVFVKMYDEGDFLILLFHVDSRTRYEEDREFEENTRCHEYIKPNKV